VSPTPYKLQHQESNTPQGQREIKDLVDYYMKNAAIIRESLTEIGLNVYGGVNSPYIWIKTPDGIDSWDFFDLLLKRRTS